MVAIPTLGRREIVAKTVLKLAGQDRLPDLLILSVTSAVDADPSLFENLTFPVQIVSGKKGASAQRNRAMKELGENDILVFLDDDFLMAADYLERVEKIFEQNPDFAVVTGNLLADGIGCSGFDHKKGQRLLTTLDKGERWQNYTEVYSGYGCNMSIRLRFVLENGLWFEEALPLYAWLEDLDFSRLLSRFGKVIKADELIGVHLGTKTSRTPGMMLGYSQIANPAFLARKGSMEAGRASRRIMLNVIANTVKSLNPEPWVDRRGRLKGNLLGLKDLMLGRSDPSRIFEIR
ncbi:MAG: glycosyltransferase family 2 protein [Alphaproteobacteria bacterium]|nr:glycosyltransferase family 2 protein [Alphaproteobacteria bacterium]